MDQGNRFQAAVEGAAGSWGAGVCGEVARIREGVRRGLRGGRVGDERVVVLVPGGWGRRRSRSSGRGRMCPGSWCAFRSGLEVLTGVVGCGISGAVVDAQCSGPGPLGFGGVVGFIDGSAGSSPAGASRSREGSHRASPRPGSASTPGHDAWQPGRRRDRGRDPRAHETGSQRIPGVSGPSGDGVLVEVVVSGRIRSEHTDDEDFYIDLLFFHRGLRRLIVIELKLGPFRAADKGQVELYLRWLDRHERREGEESPLGLILCAGKRQQQIELLELEASGIHVAGVPHGAAAAGGAGGEVGGGGEAGAGGVGPPVGGRSIGFAGPGSAPFPPRAERRGIRQS